jgi:hypothetical protein
MANLEIKVGADIRGAIAALKQFGTEIDRAGGVTEATANKMASALNKALNSAQNLSKSNIGNLDFADKFEQARQKINANIDAMVNDALGINTGFQQATVPAIKSIQQLETEMDELRAKIAETNNIGLGQKLSVQLGALEQEANKLKATFASVSQLKINANIKAVIPQSLIQQVQAFGGGVKKIIPDLNGFQRSANNVSPALARLNTSSNSSTLALINLGRVVQDAPFGFLGIANNLNPLLEGFQRLRAETGSAGGALKALGGSLMGAGGVGLAISVVSSLLVVFGDKLFGAGKSAEQQTSRIDQLKKSLNDLKAVTSSEILGSATGEFSKAVSVIETLRQNVDLAKKGFIDKKDVVNQYNKELGDTIGKVQTLDEVEKTIASKGNAYLQFTLLKAAAQEALKKASEAALQAAENEAKATDISSGAITKAAQKGLKDLPGVAGATALDKFNKATQKSVSEINKTVVQANQQKDKFINIFKDFQTRAAEIAKNNKFKFDVDIIPGTAEKQKFEFLYDFLPFDPSGKLKPEEKSKLLSAIDKFQKEFTGIFKGVNFSLAGTQDEKIKLALKFDADLKLGKVQFDTKAFADAIDKTLKPEELVPKDSLAELPKLVVDQFIKGFQSESERIQNLNPLNISPTFNINTDLNAQLDLFKTNLRRIGAQIPETIQATNVFGDPVEVTFDQLFDTSKIANNDAIDALRKAFSNIKGAIISQKEQLQNAIQNAINTTLQSIEVEGFATIGESIGAALTGGDIGNVFQRFEQFLGSAVEGLGKQIIALNVAALAVKKSLKLTFANPAIGIAAGIGLVAIGAALKNLAGAGIKGFAKGGWVGGSGNGDIVPAMLTPGEFVVTKDKAPFIAALLKLLGGGINSIKNFKLPLHFAQGGFVPTVRNTDVQSPLGNLQKALSGLAFSQSTTVIPDVKIKGSDLVLVFNRTNQSQFRNFGR